MSNADSRTANLAIGALRSLVIDMIGAANSGHPGMALDFAPSMYALFHDHLVADPAHPTWANRDRFVLSSGHVSALLYATLHLCGYAVTIEDIKSFRRLGSKTPGHPEWGWTPGVDATSGPLGQGIAQAVGMAMAEAALSAKEGWDAFGHRTYCVCGDGCLMEGVAQEAISLAGHYQLRKLTLIYDANGATLDGATEESFDEDVAKRFEACGWDVFEAPDGNDYVNVSELIGKANETDKPAVVIVHSQIGYGSLLQGSHKTHGSPLSAEDAAHAKAVYGYDYPPFTVPEEAYADFRIYAERGAKAYGEYLSSGLPLDLAKAAEEECVSAKPNYPAVEPGKAVATRSFSGKCLKAFHDACPLTFGGSADVAGSVKTELPGEAMFSADAYQGRDVHWGIREFAMASCCNGIALHGGLRPYGACFLVFADYFKPAARLAALQHLPVFYLLSHDSIAVGEDGPTHQPIEQLAMLRSIPNMEVVRPADATEVIAAYENIRLKSDGPTSLILSRQNLPNLGETSIEGAKKGGYLVYRPERASHLILATGSEVAVALSIAKKSTEQGHPIAVASLPSVSRFLNQGDAYVDSVLFLPWEKRISIEMASTFGWGGLAKHNLGIDTFGASGKAEDVIARYGFDEASLSAEVAALIQGG